MEAQLLVAHSHSSAAAALQLRRDIYIFNAVLQPQPLHPCGLSSAPRQAAVQHPPSSRSADGAQSMAHANVPSGWLMRSPVSTGISCALAPFWSAMTPSTVVNQRADLHVAQAGWGKPAQHFMLVDTSESMPAQHFIFIKSPGNFAGTTGWQDGDQRQHQCRLSRIVRQGTCVADAVLQPPSSASEAGAAVTTTTTPSPPHDRTTAQPATVPSSVRPRNTPARVHSASVSTCADVYA